MIRGARVGGMLLLAGLLSVLAAGAAAFVGLEPEPTEDEGGVDRASDGDASAPDLLTTALEATENQQNLEPDSPIEGRITSGTDNPEEIEGSPGNDQINGYAGADVIRGNAGDDQIFGGLGRDDLSGDAGDDTLHGGDGADRLFGHNGQDTLHGGAGGDSLVGSAGDDLLFGDDGNDALHGDIGNDTLEGGIGQDTLFGGWRDDVITGIVDDPNTQDLDGKDYLNGGGGNDLIIAGRGDVVSTGSGRDSIIFGDWQADGDEVQVFDFSNSEDRLAVLYDDSDGQHPVVSFEPDEEEDSYRHLLVDGVRIAVLANAGELSPDDVTLVPQSSIGARPGL